MTNLPPNRHYQKFMVQHVNGQPEMTDASSLPKFDLETPMYFTLVNWWEILLIYTDAKEQQ